MKKRIKEFSISKILEHLQSVYVEVRASQSLVTNIPERYCLMALSYCRILKRILEFTPAKGTKAQCWKIMHKRHERSECQVNGLMKIRLRASQEHYNENPGNSGATGVIGVQCSLGLLYPVSVMSFILFKRLLNAPREQVHQKRVVPNCFNY